MRNKKVFFTLLILCVVGTTIAVFLLWKPRKSLPAVLQKADSLCETHPLRALDVLDSIAPQMRQSDDFVRNKYALLTVKARDKAFIAHSSDSLIKEVVKFYDANGDVNERIEAYYYLGGVCRDLHDSPKAVSSYTTALDIAESATEGFDTLLVANVCSQLSFLFYVHCNYRQALEYARKGYSFLQTIGKCDARSMMDVATCFFHYEQKDSAFRYYEKAVEWMQKNHALEENMDILAEQFSNYAQFGDSLRADKYYALFESLVRPDNRPRNYYTSKAIYFQHRNVPDSAISYYEKAYAESTDWEKKSSAARELLRIYSMTGNDGMALKYGQYYAEAEDSVWNRLKLRQTADVYNEYRYQREMEEETAIYRRSTEIWRRSVIIVSMAILIILVFVYFYLTYRKRTRTTIEMKEKELRQRDKAIEEKEIQLRERDRAIAEGISVIERQKEEIKKTSDRNDRLASVRLQEHFENGIPDIYARFREAAVGKCELTERDWQQLYSAVADEDPDFLKQVEKRIKRVNKKNINVCYLLKCGFSKVEIQNILDIPRSTVFRLTGDLTKQLGELLDIS